MPRAIVTPSLAETLRSIRLQNKIQARQLAAHIGKSPAFISKLENGSIQTIDTNELSSILQYISVDESPVELAEQIYKSLKLKYSSKEIEEQLWFVNYDTVECLLPIPDDLIDEFNLRINRLGISRAYLAGRINANEALPEEEINDNSIPYNQWYHKERIGENAHSIKIKIPEKSIIQLLNKEYDAAPYVYIFCILYYLLKIEKYKDTILLSDEQNMKLMEETTEILNSFKFLSISEKNRILSEKQSQEEIHELLSSFDNDNIDIINDIIQGFRFATEHNILFANDQLKAFGKNMHWDLGFMLKLISMEYCSLEKTSVSNRKNLLNAIEALVKQYSDLPEEQNRIETY